MSDPISCLMATVETKLIKENFTEHLHYTTNPSIPVNTTNPSIPVNTTNPSIPVNTTNPSMPVNTTNPSIPVNTTNPSIPVNTTNPSMPVNTTNPSIPVNTTNPSIPVNTTNPSIPVNTTNPSIPVNSTNPSIPVNTTNPSIPVNTTNPSIPVNTTNPSIPVNTTNPSIPVNTTNPSIPVNTTDPSIPVNTTDPSIPVNTTNPSIPVNTTNPSIPVNTTNPSIPVNTTNPSIPVNTTNPSIPVNTTNPSIPVNTTNPSIPVNTTNPSIPVNTTNPSIPVNTTNPSIPVNTTNPSIPVNTTNPFLNLNPFIDYSEENSMMSADSMEAQHVRLHFYTRVNTAESNTVVNNMSFSSTNPFLNDIEKDAQSSDSTFVISTTQTNLQRASEVVYSTPLSASVDNLFEMNCTPIKSEETNTFDLNATQIKRLSCKLNDENLSKANEQLNLLLSDSPPTQNESTLCPNVILSQRSTGDSFHSPDSLNADDEIKMHHNNIDEDNRSKNSSDIDCIPIVSGGTRQSTSWTLAFNEQTSKSSSSLIKHADSFSHNSKSCGFYIDLNEPAPRDDVKPKPSGDAEKKIFNMFIDISNSDSSDKEKKSPRPLLRKKMKPTSMTERFLQRQYSGEDHMKSNASAEDSDGEHPEVMKGKTLFRNIMTPPPSTQTSTTDQSTCDLTESTNRKQGASGFFMFIGNDSTPVVKRRLSSGSGCHGNAPARTNPNRHSWNSDSAPPPPSSNQKKHRRAASVSCRLSDLETSPSAPVPGDTKLTSSWHAASHKKLMDSSGDSSVLADTKSDTTSSLKSDATYNIEDNTTGSQFKAIPEDSSEPNDTYVVESKQKSNRTLVLDTQTPTLQDEEPDVKRAPAKMTEVFVKLSDMDCPRSKSPHSPLPPPSRLSRSTQDSKLVQSSKSLSRLFPHLVGGTGASLSSSQEDGHTTISTVSSLQSSNNRSTLDVSTDGGEGLNVKASCTLGADLLRMFLEEISADVTVEVAGRRIKAHKCVLSSRCQYFAAVLSGGWVESAGNVISLQGYSYSTVHFALCHIYSGVGEMPDNINIVELVTLADMLCLEGLKEVISGVLKHKYCHYFHKPCSTCLVGVIEVLPLAVAYGLDDIYRKSLRWIAKYFIQVWPTKPFASMPKELIDKCVKQILVHMTSENVLDSLMSCEKVIALLPPGVKWTEPITHALGKLQDACAKYIGQHLSCVLTSGTLLHLTQDELWDIGSVESILLGAGSKLSPDEACRVYVQLDVMLHHTPQPTWHQSFGACLVQLESIVKSCLVRQATKSCRSPAWQMMPLNLRLHIQETAGLILVPGDEKRRARMMRKTGGSEVGTHGSKTSRTLDLQQVRQSISAQQTRKAPVPDLIPRAKAKPKFSEVKSRYLDSSRSRPSRHSDPAPPLTASTSSSSSVTHPTRPRAAPVISSSESSRQSSPALTKRIITQVKDKSTSRLSLDSKLKSNSPQDMKLVRDRLTLNIRKSHETDLKVKKIPTVAMTTRLPLRSNENKTTLTHSARLSLDNNNSKSLRSSPLDNRTKETLRASTDRLSLDTLSSRNKRRTGSSSSTTSCSSTKASLSTVTTPNMNKKPVNTNLSPIKMNKTALLRSSRNNNSSPARGTKPGETKKLGGVGTRSGTFCMDESASILKNINSALS
ncbi:hypothetical protein M8J76_004347 [Diaphorina citri]|nr:hypothetical protein M8J76_004347 [Diaphorina citri]